MLRLLGTLACVVTVALAGLAHGASAARYGDRAQYFRLADDGIPRTLDVWWNPAARWFAQTPHSLTDGPRQVATLWDVFPFFEAIDLVAIAHPSPARRAMVEQIGRGAERYWNPEFKPLGGYWFLPFRRPNVNVFFDDNGWWGLAFFDAYAATHNRRFLRDAVRAFRFIEVAGWAKKGGGVWWDTDHRRKTAEPLAAEALLGAELYRATHNRHYLRVALRMINWANRKSFNRQRGLYQRNETDDTVMNYVQGMMIGAHSVLCATLKKKAYCNRARRLAAAALRAFPLTYHWSTETDAIYLRGLLTLYSVDHDRRWYRIADYWAQKAVANGRDSRGIFSRRWDGAAADKTRLLIPGGTLMLLSAVAAAPQPRDYKRNHAAAAR